jgi:hypothetical protein
MLITLPDGSSGYSFLNSEEKSLTLDKSGMDKLKRVPYDQWSRITNEMREADVVKIIGEPLLIDALSENESIWQYGLLLGNSNVVSPSRISIVVSNGLVSQSFHYGPAAEFQNVELLSKPRTNNNFLPTQ